MIHYPYDLHTHTKLSDGWDDVRGNVRSAEACGMEMVAITDHYAENAPDVIPQILEQVKAARQESPIRVLTGVEAYVKDGAGAISISPERAALLDLVLADFGGRTEGIGHDAPKNKTKSLNKIVGAIVGMSQQAHVHILAHPFNLGRLDCPLTFDDLPQSALLEIAQAMASGGLVFEIMNQFHYWWPSVSVAELSDRYAGIVALFAQEGVRFSLGSDAHRTGAIGNLQWCYRIATQAQLCDAMMFVPD